VFGLQATLNDGIEKHHIDFHTRYENYGIGFLEVFKYLFDSRYCDWAKLLMTVRATSGSFMMSMGLSR